MAASRQAVRSKKVDAGRSRQIRLRGLSHYLADGAAGEFDRLIYERVRLGIMSALSVNKTMSFSDLRALLGTTDGNLSVHARKLERAGYLNCSKSFEGRFPKTDFKLTAKGRRALERYLDHMEALIERVRE